MIVQKLENKEQSTKTKIATYCKVHKKLIIAEAIGLLFCLAMSFVFHFAYEWLKKPFGIAFLFATNESVWEHSKIIFYPYLIYSLVEFFILKPAPKSYLTAKCLPLMLCIPAMLVLFYTYSGIIGTNYIAVDITISVAIIISMFATSYKILSNKFSVKHYILLAIIAAIILVLIVVFTYYPPHISLFFDKTKGVYGIN